MLGTRASVQLGDGSCAHSGASKCIPRRRGQLSGEAQAEEVGGKGEEVGGQWVSEKQRRWVLGRLGLL